MSWYPIESARKDGTRYILFAKNTRLGTYTGSWMLRWGIIDGQKVQCEGWWLDGFEAPSQPTHFAIVPFIPEEVLKPPQPENTHPQTEPGT